MKGIKCCAECADYSLKKHKCTRGAKDPGKATDSFYADCPLVDAQPLRCGRWDEIQCFSEHGIEMASYECTSCGIDIERQRGLVPPYCEYCGAKMYGGAG